MAEPKKTGVPLDELECDEKPAATVAGVELKSNFGSACTALNGNMNSMISKYGRVGIRLPQDEREAILECYDTELFRADPSWPPAKELVALPGDLLAETAALTPYLEISLEYVKTLKPKPTTQEGRRSLGSPV